MRALTLLPALALAACAGDYEPQGPVDARFSAPGPHDVHVLEAFACCDRDGSPFHAWLPDTDAPVPLVLWGNGTAATTDDYATLLEHLASWGFALVAPENPAVGDGEPLRQALDVALRGHLDPDSPLAGRLDPDRIGAMGHSQGAGGATNLMRLENDRVTALVTLSRPHAQWCTRDALCPSPADLERGAVFYVTGGRDVIMAPPTAQRTAYRQTPDTLDKARATLKGARHTDAQGEPACDDVPGCARGSHGYLGYPTAWLTAHLHDDDDALQAFVAGGELDRGPDWSDFRSNVEAP